MNLTKRIVQLEQKILIDDDGVPEAILLLSEDCSGDDVPSKKITRLSCHGTDILRDPGESYENFKQRAIAKARNGLEFGRRDGKGLPVPDPIPVLIADGSLEE